MQATVLVERKGGEVPSFHGRGFSPSLCGFTTKKYNSHDVVSVDALQL